jgi:hypothetical protein
MTKPILLLLVFVASFSAVAQKKYDKQFKKVELSKEIKQSKLLVLSPFKSDKARHDKLVDIVNAYTGEHIIQSADNANPLLDTSGVRYVLVIQRDVSQMPTGGSAPAVVGSYELSLYDKQDPLAIEAYKILKPYIDRKAGTKEMMKAMASIKEFPKPVFDLGAGYDWDGALQFVIEKLNAL